MRSVPFAAQILIAVTVLRIATLAIPVFNQDECYIAIQAQVVNDGGEMYRDVVDRKPPLVPYVYAAVFELVGSDSLIAVHALAILWVAAIALVLAAIMRRRAGPTEAKLAAWLFVFSSMSLLPRDALAANFEIWMLLPLCAAMLVAGRGRPALDGLAGVLLGIAVFMKQPALVTIAPLGFVILRSPRPVLGIAAMLVGLASVFAAVIGTHDPMLLEWVFLGTGGYITTSDIAFAMLMALIWTGTFLIANAGVCWLVYRSARQRGIASDADLWIWLAVSFVAVAVGLRFLGHYHLQLLPPACLLAARPAAMLVGVARRRVAAAVAAPAIICAVLAFFMPNQPFDTDYRNVATYLRTHTDRDDRVLVWGHFPEIYWAAERRPAMRFIHTGFMTGQSGARPIRPADTQAATNGAWDMMFEDLALHPPVYVVDLSPGAVRKAHHWPMQRYPKVAAWLVTHYRLESIVDGIWLYRRCHGRCTGAFEAAIH